MLFVLSKEIRAAVRDKGEERQCLVVQGPVPPPLLQFIIAQQLAQWKKQVHFLKGIPSDIMIII